MELTGRFAGCHHGTRSAEAWATKEYNAAYRAVVKTTGLTPAVIRDIERGGFLKGGKPVEIAEYKGLDTKAPILAREYPELGLQPEAANVEQRRDYAQDLVDVIKRGPRAVPEWRDKLDEVAREMAAEKGKPLPDDFHFPWEGEPGEGFEPSSTVEPEAKPSTKKPILPRKARVASAKQAFSDALAEFHKLATGKLYANPLDPELIASATKLTARAIDLGIATFSEFMARMRDAFGRRPRRPAKRSGRRGSRIESPVKSRRLFGTQPICPKLAGWPRSSRDGPWSPGLRIGKRSSMKSTLN